ncbi:MAG: VWA domain-containing protein [Candidatus Poribacteria bacterium]|nr:VWA domain-containing protein [Candidatus Poribacteria bacterium]
MFDFRSPFFLILLAAIPFLILIQLRTTVIAAKWRKRITFFFRCTAILCAILALANLQRTNKEQRLAVVFLFDTSDSIDPSQQEDVINQINAAIVKLKPSDQFGVISFAQESSVLIEMGAAHEQPSLTPAMTESSVEQDSTDILTSLKRSLELLPENYHRRIVLLSDGIHNTGTLSIKDYLPLFSASDIEIMTIPLNTIKDAIRVQELQLPNQVRKGQPYPIQAIIESDGSIPKVTTTLYHNDVPITDIEFPLQKGRNVLTFPTQQVSEDRPHTYQLKLDVNDEIFENNQAYGVVQIQDKPHILYAEGDLDHADSLKEVFEENSFVINVISATEIPTDLVTLQHYDVLILSNISADTLLSEQKDIIETYVRDLGHGLVVIGGDRAFGPGGYTDTALERVLPIEMTPRERKESVALVFAIDTSGSMANYVGAEKKIELAIEAIRAGIRNLKGEDQAAVIGFDVKLRDISLLTSDHDALIDVVGKLKPTGGTTAMGKAIETAGKMLKSSDAKRRHIILLSDGKSEGEPSKFIDTAKDLSEARIVITTIAIGDADKKLLKEIAIAGNGRSEDVKNIQELPDILVDAVRETQNYIVQEQFQPIIVHPITPILEGLDTLPMLYGYVATAEKSAAQVYIGSHEDEPVLVGWYYGLGKSVAWTSDVKSAWSKDWIPWSDFGKFWGQVINWTLPTEETNANFDLIVSPRNGRAEVVIDTQHASPTSYAVQVAGPNGTSESVEMQQESTTRYIGTFQMNDSGSYIVTAKRETDDSKLTETVTLSYPAEYADFDVDHTMLKRLAEDTGGIYEPTATQIAASAGVPIEKRVSLSQTLLVVAVALFVLEMILRRFSIASGYFTELRAQLRRQSESVVPKTLTQLTQKKADVDSLANSGVYETVEITSSTNENTSETTVPQSAEGTMTRLLAAKNRSRSV